MNELWLIEAAVNDKKKKSIKGKAAHRITTVCQRRHVCVFTADTLMGRYARYFLRPGPIFKMTWQVKYHKNHRESDRGKLSE